MYHYPIEDYSYFSIPIKTSSDEHTMGNSLEPYLDMKVPSVLLSEKFDKVIVQPKFDRTSGISDKEKNDKPFNYMRPTVIIRNEIAYVNCFPGFDYVFHYASILKTFFSLKGKKVLVEISLPKEQECCDELYKSGLNKIQKADTVIMGNVQNFQFISQVKKWRGTGNFLWKPIEKARHEAILLGCKHTFWGEISGRIIMILAQKGVKKIIYSGKLGMLNPDLEPNKILATGNKSILPNGKIVEWTNIFEEISSSYIHSGIHITLPSVLQETKTWLANQSKNISYVDPEIGHMANAAQQCGISFSYLHIISDNLSVQYSSDLSNERKKDVIASRKELSQIISGHILKYI